MKKLISLILTAAILLICPTLAEDALNESDVYSETSLAVANPTPMRGEFFTNLWGNSTSDIDVRDLLHAYNLIMWDGENGMFTVDPSVVSGVAATINESGDHSYYLVLCDDLYFSDGSRITAWDYAFSYLFSISPVLSEIGARPLRFEQLAGYEDYITNGTALTGVRVISDDTLIVTLNHEYLPFFYEMGLLSCNPYPISVIAPGVEVRDDGDGVYLSNIDDTTTWSLFNAELLSSTILDAESGYMSHPSVVSGPYTLSSWDGITAEFEINPYYKGNYKGELPSIERLRYTLADNDEMLSKLSSGEIGLINKVTRADKVMEAIGLMEDAGLSMSTYPRLGLSYISFATEKATVSDLSVRQAIAYCFDRDQAVEDYTGFFGLRADGYYGIGQWMYGIVSGTMAPPVDPPEDESDSAAQAAYEEALSAYEELSLDELNAYEVDIDMAIRLLEADGWLLNAEGIREKDGTVLKLKLIYPIGNNIYESLDKNLVKNLETAGIELTMEAVPMDELLTRWYKQDERDEDMIYLASNFEIVFDPSVNFSPDGAWNYTNLVDEELYNAAVAMRTTEPGDVLGYMQNWIRFQKRFNEILPMIPLYTNVYFDFYTDALQDYAINESVTWGQAIVSAWIGEAETDDFEVDEELFAD